MTEVTDRIAEARPRRFRPYPKYKDTGVEWLGRIPAHWEVGRFKDHGALVGGAGFPHDYQGTDNEVLPFYKVGDLSASSDGRYMGQAPHTVSSEIAAELGAHVIPPDSIIYAKIGAALLLNRRRLTTIPCCIDNNMSAYVPRQEELLSGWAFYLTAIVDFAALANPGAVPSLSEGDQVDIPIVVPPTTEQRAITAFLDHETARIDALVARKERLIELLQEKRTALITRAVTRGLDPNIPMKNSGVEWLGEIPVHWDVKRVKWVARMESGHTPDKKVDAYWKDGDIPWVSLNDTRHLKDHDYINDTEYYTNELGLKNSSARLLSPRSVVFSRDATIGLCAITERAMAVSQHFIAWICSEDVIPEYLLRVFDAMQGELERLAMGATLRTIGMPEVNTLATPVPPVDEQEVIVNHIHQERLRLDLLIAKIHEAIDILNEFRTALISAAVTGKIDVREAMPR